MSEEEKRRVCQDHVKPFKPSGLVNLVFSRQNGFFECEHPLIDKTIVITEPAVASALLLEGFRFRDEDDYEYEIFLILSIAHPLISVILAEKRDSRRHSTTSFGENVVVRRFTILPSVEGLTCPPSV